MRDSLYNRLWRRECGDLSARAGLRDIYGSKEWVSDLDIVNELGGHTGCVNALRYVSHCTRTYWSGILGGSASLLPEYF